MGEYYLIRETSDPKVNGIGGGTAQSELQRENFANKEYFDDYISYFEPSSGELLRKNRTTLPNFDIDFEYVKLHKKALLTDFLSFSPNLFNGGLFLLSERAYLILNKFNLGTHKFFNANLYSDKGKRRYYYLCCPSLGYEVIDFSKSLFFEGSDLLGKQFHKFSSIAEYEKKKDCSLLRSQSIVFTNRFDKSLDYFSTIVSIPGIYISNDLKEAILGEGLSGVNILEPVEPTLRFDF